MKKTAFVRAALVLAFVAKPSLVFADQRAQPKRLPTAPTPASLAQPKGVGIATTGPQCARHMNVDLERFLYFRKDD